MNTLTAWRDASDEIKRTLPVRQVLETLGWRTYHGKRADCGRCEGDQRETISFSVGKGLQLLAAAGVERVDDQEVRSKYGIRGSRSRDMSGIVFPYFDPITGERTTARDRPDDIEPEVERADAPPKYVSPWGNKPRLYFPPADDLFLEIAMQQGAAFNVYCMNGDTVRNAVITANYKYGILIRDSAGTESYVFKHGVMRLERANFVARGAR